MKTNNPSGLFFTEHQPLLWAIDQCSTHNIAIEVGTYYGGWTGVLSAAYTRVITLQAMSDKKLMNVFYNTLPTPHGTENSVVLNSTVSKKDKKSKKDTKLASSIEISNNVLYSVPSYNFSYMVDIVRDMKNVTPILTESPPRLDWHWKFDLCAIDISRFPDENLKQYNYWKKHANPNAMMLIGVYKLKPGDSSAITLDQFMSSIDKHCDFVPGNDNYIYVKF